MPPKARFTREEIVDAAVRVLRRDGEDGITARAVAAELGSSPRPIFTVFSDMDEVKAGVLRLALDRYKQYVDEGLGEELAFRGVGTAYLKFAGREPAFFRLLFMKERSHAPLALADALYLYEESYARILSSVESYYSLSRPKAEALYRNMWIYVHGIAVMTVTNIAVFSEQDAVILLSRAFRAFLWEVNGNDRGV